MLTLDSKQFATSLSQMLGRFNKLAVPSVQDQTLRISARGSQMQLHDAWGGGGRVKAVFFIGTISRFLRVVS